MLTLKVERISRNNNCVIQSDLIRIDQRTSLENFMKSIGYSYRNFLCLASMNETTLKEIQFQQLEELTDQADITKIFVQQQEEDRQMQNIEQLGSQQKCFQNVKGKITIKNKNEVLKRFEADLTKSCLLQEIVQDFIDNHGFDVDQQNWSCFSAERNKYLEKSGKIEGDREEETLTFEVIETQILIQVQIKEYDKEKHQTQIKLYLQTTIGELLARIQNEFDIQGQIERWTCYSKNQNKYCLDSHDLIDEKFKGDTFIINVGDNAKQSVTVRCQPNNSQNWKACSAHPVHQIHSICLEEQSSRKLCLQCLQDLRDQNQDMKKILTLEKFDEYFQKNANKLLSQKDIFQDQKNKINSLKQRFYKLMEDYSQDLETAFKLVEKFIKICDQILETLKRQHQWLPSNQFIDEMVYVLNNKIIEKQIEINKVNSITLQQNIQKFEFNFDQFQNTINNLSFHLVPFYKCDINEYCQELSANYDGKNLLKLSMRDNEYGKYLISQQNIKIEIWDNFRELSTITYDIERGSKLKDMKSYVENTLKLQNKLAQCLYHSRVQDKDLSDSEEQLSLLINQDVIKIILPNLQQEIKASLKMFDLKIVILIGSQQKTMFQSFCGRSTLQDIENAVLNFCKIEKDDKIDIFYEFFNHEQITVETEKRTLFQLQLQSNSQVKAHIQQKNFSYHLEPVIVLECLVEYGENQTKQIFLPQVISNRLENLVQKIFSDCKINQDFYTIDIFINNQHHNERELRNKTFEQLGITNNQIIIGKVRQILW